MKRSEAAAFEVWADLVRPSGDADAVQYAWARSDAYLEWLDEVAHEQELLLLAPLS